jgi:pyruvate/2-oxoglutarate dehydrogenase complex dihydrolipoamide dehydrogenase (E3) component
VNPSPSSPGEHEEVDVIVIGLGNGGEGVLTHLKDSGLSVVGVEQHLVGGECPFYACIPTKMIRHEAARPRPDFSRVARRIREDATDDWDDTQVIKNLAETGAEIIKGTAWFTGSRTVEVTPNDGSATRTLHARRAVVLGTGSESIMPDFEGAEDVGLWTHRDITTAEKLPASLAIIGGGVIACELAQAVARFGVSVTMLVRSRLLSSEEPVISDHLLEIFRSEGIDVRLGVEVVSASRDDDGVALTLSDGSALSAEQVLAATGRRPRMNVTVDERCRVVEDGNPSDWLYAVGDLTGHGSFTHAAVEHGEVVAEGILSRDAVPVEVHAVPHVVFTDPEAARVGLTQSEAADDWDAVSVTKDLNENSRGWMDEVHGSLTLVVERQTGLLLGASLVGPSAGEIIGALTLAVHAKMTVQRLRRVMWAFPTLHRVIKDAIEELDLS